MLVVNVRSEYLHVEARNDVQWFMDGKMTYGFIITTHICSSHITMKNTSWRGRPETAIRSSPSADTDYDLVRTIILSVAPIETPTAFLKASSVEITRYSSETGAVSRPPTFEPTTHLRETLCVCYNAPTQASSAWKT
jgi:hypothetical protein